MEGMRMNQSSRGRQHAAGYALMMALLLLGAVGCGEREKRPEVETGTVSPHAADTAVQPPGGMVPPTTPSAEPGLAGRLPAGVTEEMTQDGRAIFVGAGICFSCHGRDGEGGPLGPALNDPEFMHIDGTYEEIVRIIRVGVPQPQRYPGAMPPMGGARLTEDQLRAVSAYVYTISRGR
jgi:mono/diheme cytochrome c family protein